nr:MAG TPA: hypothetical protein [Caudoviricetes sp.]
MLMALRKYSREVSHRDANSLCFSSDKAFR